MSVFAQGQNVLSYLNDEFLDSSTLANWNFFHQEEGWPDHTLKVDINKSTPNTLHLEPNTGFWFGEVHCGPYLYKEIEGNFTITTRLKANGRQSAIPEKAFSLAGIMLRSPRPEGVSKFEKRKENWLFLSTGFAKKTKGVAPGVQFETKVTINSKSKLKIVAAPRGWVEIAISRMNNHFYLSYKNKEGEWELIRTIEHPNMAQKIQVGLIAYTDFNSKMKRRYVFNRKKLNTTIHSDGSPDLIANFDYVRFYPVQAKGETFNNKNWKQILSLP